MHFNLTTVNIKIFCRRQFLLMPHVDPLRVVHLHICKKVKMCSLEPGERFKSLAKFNKILKVYQNVRITSALFRVGSFIRLERCQNTTPKVAYLHIIQKPLILSLKLKNFQSFSNKLKNLKRIIEILKKQPPCFKKSPIVNIKRWQKTHPKGHVKNNHKPPNWSLQLEKIKKPLQKLKTI